MELQIRRVYDAASPDDGFRVLVDRLWPRGVSKERAAVDLWAKDVAPSHALRTAYHHEGMPWERFAEAYRRELAENPAVDTLRTALAARPTATLVSSAHDPAHSHAVLLRDALTA